MRRMLIVHAAYSAGRGGSRVVDLDDAARANHRSELALAIESCEFASTIA